MWPLDPNGEVLVAIMCEDVVGMKNLPKILKQVQGIGAVIIGGIATYVIEFIVWIRVLALMPVEAAVASVSEAASLGEFPPGFEDMVGAEAL